MLKSRNANFASNIERPQKNVCFVFTLQVAHLRLQNDRFLSANHLFSRTIRCLYFCFYSTLSANLLTRPIFLQIHFLPHIIYSLFPLKSRACDSKPKQSDSRSVIYRRLMKTYKTKGEYTLHCMNIHIYYLTASRQKQKTILGQFCSNSL